MYEPQVDDYVRWTTALGMVHEGWVYFKGDPTPKKRGFPKSEHYITIELGVRDMPPQQAKTSLHKKLHVLCCAIIQIGTNLNTLRTEEKMLTYQCIILKKVVTQTYNENTCNQSITS